MIRFSDKEVYNITEGEMTRSQLLGYFLCNTINKMSVIAVYSEEGSYTGIIKYYALLQS